MLRQSDEEDYAAPLQPSFTTPTKAICNDGASHCEPDAKETDAYSDSDVEKNSTSRRACRMKDYFDIWLQW